MLANRDFYEILKELIEFGISRYERDFFDTYKGTDLVFYQKYTSEDVQNFLNASERGIQVHLFVRKNKDDKISKEFYYLGHMKASGKVREFVMANTDKTAVEIE